MVGLRCFTVLVNNNIIHTSGASLVSHSSRSVSRLTRAGELSVHEVCHFTRAVGAAGGWGQSVDPAHNLLVMATVIVVLSLRVGPSVQVIQLKRE